MTIKPCQTSIQMQLCDAIEELRPEFAERDRLSQTVLDLTTSDHRDTYFATIPRDIVGIIREYLPNLRRRYTIADIQQIIADSATQYNQFMARYLKYVQNGNIYLDKGILLADFPELVSMTHVMGFDVKIVNGHPCFYRHAAMGAVYMGNNYFSLTTPGGGRDTIVQSIGQTLLQTAGGHRAPQDYMSARLLPCGLVLSHRANIEKPGFDNRIYSLTDPANHKSIDVDFDRTIHYGLLPMDDYGDSHPLSYNVNALLLCDNTGGFLKVDAKY